MVTREIAPEDLARIGRALYAGASYNGRTSWQSWLADGLAVDGATVRRWLMPEGVASRRAVPPTVATLLLASERISGELRMADQPRGTLIVDRMSDIVARASRTVAVGSIGDHSRTVHTILPEPRS